ncbi:MAG TPA: hypothetical protein VFQ61_26210 [Polyangiaceae bacterium]|nr:hypothetical protein [Polyangiaceae bacterium]
MPRLCSQGRVTLRRYGVGGVGLCVSSLCFAPGVAEAVEPGATSAEGETANDDEPRSGDSRSASRPTDSAARTKAAAEAHQTPTEESASTGEEPHPADQAASEATTSDGTERPSGDKHPAKKHKKHRNSILHGGNTGHLEVRGRVFALSELTRRRRATPDLSGFEPYNAWQLSLASARMALDYESPMPWLSAQVELELGDGISLKDGFIQARDEHFTVRAGQFKMPISPLEVESPWSLPIVRRGFMHRLLNDWLDIGGRSPGILVGVRDKHGIRPSLTAAVFQGRTLRRVPAGVNRDTTGIGAVSMDSQSYVLRAGVEILHIGLGAWYEYRVGSPSLGVSDRFHTGGVDATLDLQLPHGGLRVWSELVAGESWYKHRYKTSTENPIFVEGRALVALRFGGVEDDDFYVEPFGMFGGFDADRDIRSDLAWEAAAGMNVGFWKRARLTLQGEVNRTGENFPETFFPNSNVERESLLLQAGVAW